MNRKEIYAYIKEHGLQKEVENKLHKNFTNCPTAALEGFVNAKLQEESIIKVIENCVKKPIKATEDTIKDLAQDIDEEDTIGHLVSISSLGIALVHLVECLSKRHILLPSEVNYIIKGL